MVAGGDPEGLRTIFFLCVLNIGALSIPLRDGASREAEKSWGQSGTTDEKGGGEGRQDWGQDPGGKEIPIPLGWES